MGLSSERKVTETLWNLFQIRLEMYLHVNAMISEDELRLLLKILFEQVICERNIILKGRQTEGKCLPSFGPDSIVCPLCAKQLPVSCYLLGNIYPYINQEMCSRFKRQ